MRWHGIIILYSPIHPESVLGEVMVNDRVCRELTHLPLERIYEDTLSRCLFLEVQALNKDLEKREEIISRLEEASKDGRISCAVARKIAEDMQVSYRTVGSLCDELKLKIKACELGCF